MTTTMPKQNPARPAAKVDAGSKKRKDPPTNANNGKKDNKRPRNDHRSKQRDMRVLATQTSSKAFKNGQLDVDTFVKSREYEIRALEEGMSRSKQALTKRAFQQVPRDLRRRTASHNVKRVPKRLQPRAKREMVEDNTPTVSSKTRKPTRHMRLRLETVKKLRALGAKSKASKDGKAEEKVTVRPYPKANAPDTANDTAVKTRTAKVKKVKLATPPKPTARFRKRQIDKTWLPTHMFHAKRARMTAPKEALWRFSIPLTPTAKSYRPTHRSANERGAIAWDMSYMATISLCGQQRSIEGVLKALHLNSKTNGNDPWSAQSERWRKGSRAFNGFVLEREAPHKPIAPVTVLWSPQAAKAGSDTAETNAKQLRTAFIRVHPAAFLQLWEEVVRLAKVAKPQISVEDLRYEIGSIEITGPGATEALLGALWPSPTTNAAITEPAKTWNALAGLTDLALLPRDVVIGLDVQDPRLHHPPRPIKLPQTTDAQQRLLELSAIWPLEAEHISSGLFDRRARQRASSALPTQKSINRRKTTAVPGQFPELLPSDPSIPTIIYSTTNSKSRASSWTMLLPWKCVQPVWYSIMYYPLSTGGQPRFGGLDEKRQLAFETNQPWFPGDYPGTKAGWQWEKEQAEKRKDHWARRPKSKRVNWDVVKAGVGVKGEIGLGWACDWSRLLNGPPTEAPPKPVEESTGEDTAMPDAASAEAQPPPAPETVQSQNTPPITSIPSSEASRLLHASSPETTIGSTLLNPTITISLHCLTRGTPQTCARIYRLPSTSSALRKAWLALHPNNKPRKSGPKNGLPPALPKDAPAYLVQRHLAQSLVQGVRANEESYPECPGEEDLIGFVTTGNLNLSEGRGTGIGNLLLSKVLEDWKKNGEEEARLCIVRNSGQNLGRLAKWELA
ncbi:Ribonucleases P/MRP protein subunit pop1 [Cercospora beticola]|uniref:Ribonucleases P/MRP protein subunit pop1 n=1 Tax=Cercospora beticola TaxID=122368 RepID=A0A2G5I9M2_CERBT|nr:Ribonucleases P/MRP protein subunit pop1 [Cercospora beticola]PIB01479.1 Ribonucleases P/MRP protein subunit pop1 [Cercospora beticola]WPA97022.1 hypothetical protein RHO25_001630 [Cercospora beticola]CAK1354581.1 unnamed protein product [Cercospora beticola]